MNWSAQQEKALTDVSAWLARGRQSFFRLFGYAGSGKTSLAKYFAEGASQVLYAAYTGKAASVMRSKGCTGATTLHKLLYRPNPKSKKVVEELIAARRKMLDDLTTTEDGRQKLTLEAAVLLPQIRKLDEAIRIETDGHRRPSWVLNEESAVKGADLIIVDEVSMVDRKIGEDLLSFGTPILVLGDPAQLPPVMGTGFFMAGTPDTLLTEIHRQDADNPILHLAHTVRSGGTLKVGKYGRSEVISKSDLKHRREDIMGADQALCGRNVTRHSYNARMRELRGYAAALPVVGDKLVCTRNDHERGILNGEIWVVKDCADVDEETIELQLASEDGDRGVDTIAHKNLLLNRQVSPWLMREKACFEYGQTLTVHKSQGSQWDKVFIVDESACFRQDRSRHLYTAITRAARQVVVAI
jgi:exodeoxyribonuclease-5